MSAIQPLKNSFTYVGILFILEGSLLLLFPNCITQLIFLKPLETAQAEQYVRILGFAVAVMGLYYATTGIYALVDFYRVSIIARTFALPAVAAMIYFYSLEMPLLVFGIQDLVTAFWSYTCLKAYDAEQAKLKK